MTTALITGITGQDGAYLSELLLNKGYDVFGVLNPARPHKLKNLKYLGLLDDIHLTDADLLDRDGVSILMNEVKPDEIYNLAAQSSVGASFRNPIETIEFNTISVLNILEAIKTSGGSARFYQASSSEMYGVVERLPITESTPMHPRSPYAVSKAAAHWTTVNYRESYGIFACCGVLFNHESFLREPSFFVKKIIIEAFEVAEGMRDKILVGNLDVRRDFGYSPRYVQAMHAMVTSPEPEDYLVCSGQSVSLRSILEYVLNKLDLDPRCVEIDKRLFRPAEIFDIYGDNSKAQQNLGWTYDLDFFNVLDMLIDEERTARQVQ